MINYYGEELAAKLREDALTSEDFEGKKGELFINRLAKKTIQFQKKVNKPKSEMQKSVQLLEKRMEKLGLDKYSERGPEFLVAPYFYFIRLDHVWYSYSLRVAKAALKYKGRDKKLYAVIAFHKDLLDDPKESASRLIKDYAAMVCFIGYLI